MTTKTILHTVNQSHSTSSSLQQCLDYFTPNDAIVLLEDGVYNALAYHSSAEKLSGIPHCYAIDDDIKARGLDDEDLLPNIQRISYDDFVNLSVQHPLSQSWF